MRAYALVLIVFIFSLSLSMVKNLDITGTGVGEMYIDGVTTSTYAYNNANSMGTIAGIGQQAAGDTTSVWNTLNQFYRIIVIGIPFTVQLFYDCTFGLPAMLTIIGMPAIVSWPLSILAWVIYLFGLVQWITGKSFREHE